MNQLDLTISELLKTFLIGVVEGLTEWLPISSTGHMILVDDFVKLNVSKPFMDMFLIVIQLGAILAVVVLNFEKLNPFSPWKNKLQRRNTLKLWLKVIIACIPAAAVGIPLNDWMEENLMTTQVVAAMLILYGVLFIIVEYFNRFRIPRFNTVDFLDFKTAFIIGVFQVLALVPGTSRSGATILGGILFGASRVAATEFTFFLAIPVMFGASLIKIMKFGLNWSGSELIILAVGMITAFIVSILSIKFLLMYIKKNDFTAFGWYRIVLGLIVLGYLFFIGDPILNG